MAYTRMATFFVVLGQSEKKHMEIIELFELKMKDIVFDKIMSIHWQQRNI